MSEWDVCTCHRCRTVDKDWISLLYQLVRVGDKWRRP